MRKHYEDISLIRTHYYARCMDTGRLEGMPDSFCIWSNPLIQLTNKYMPTRFFWSLDSPWQNIVNSRDVNLVSFNGSSSISPDMVNRSAHRVIDEVVNIGGQAPVALITNTTGYSKYSPDSILPLGGVAKKASEPAGQPTSDDLKRQSEVDKLAKETKAKQAAQEKLAKELEDKRIKEVEAAELARIAAEEEEKKKASSTAGLSGLGGDDTSKK
jgi:hypothetical protein